MAICPVDYQAVGRRLLDAMQARDDGLVSKLMDEYTPYPLDILTNLGIIEKVDKHYRVRPDFYERFTSDPFMIGTIKEIPSDKVEDSRDNFTMPILALFYALRSQPSENKIELANGELDLLIFYLKGVAIADYRRAIATNNN